MAVTKNAICYYTADYIYSNLPKLMHCKHFLLFKHVKHPRNRFIPVVTYYNSYKQLFPQLKLIRKKMQLVMLLTRLRHRCNNFPMAEKMAETCSFTAHCYKELTIGTPFNNAKKFSSIRYPCHLSRKTWRARGGVLYGQVTNLTHWNTIHTRTRRQFGVAGKPILHVIVLYEAQRELRTCQPASLNPEPKALHHHAPVPDNSMLLINLC